LTHNIRIYTNLILNFLYFVIKAKLKSLFVGWFFYITIIINEFKLDNNKLKLDKLLNNHMYIYRL
jgi:hypothetical protein